MEQNTATTMPIPKRKVPFSFLSTPSTYWVTLIRLLLILLPRLLNGSDYGNGTSSLFLTSQWLYSPAFLSVLVRPHETLSHLQEAQAVQALSGGKTLGEIYNANHSIRIPPLVFAALSRFTDIWFSTELLFSLILVFVDMGIAYMLEQIGNRLLLSLDDPKNEEEESLQRILPETIRPPYAHIFPIYTPREPEPDAEATQDQSAMIPMASLPLLAAQFYYWSPFTAFPSGLYQCWQNIAPLFLVASIYESCRTHGSVTMSTFYLAVAAHLEPHHAIMIIPIGLLLCRNDDRGSFSKVTLPISIALFGLWSMGLQVLACSLVTTAPNTCYAYYLNSVLGATYGDAWLTTSPNLSLQWYFHMQLFTRFRAYFGAIFTGIPFVMVGPLSIRLGNYPGVLVSALDILGIGSLLPVATPAVPHLSPLSPLHPEWQKTHNTIRWQIATFSLIWTIYRPMQVLYDANLAFCFFLFSPRSLARMETPAFVSLCCLLVPVILNVVDHWMWLDANNGNANYMFFQCLAYNVFLAVVLGQFTTASMQRDKALRIIAKEEKGRAAASADKEKSE